MSGDDEYWDWRVNIKPGAGMDNNQTDYDRLQEQQDEALERLKQCEDLPLVPYHVLKPRPEWWSPSEYSKPEASTACCIRLSSITAIDTLSGEIVIYAGISEPVEIYYDTPEHRDEDFTRLKLALGVE